jgi:hypothetical protein
MTISNLTKKLMEHNELNADDIIVLISERLLRKSLSVPIDEKNIHKYLIDAIYYSATHDFKNFTVINNKIDTIDLYPPTTLNSIKKYLPKITEIINYNINIMTTTYIKKLILADIKIFETIKKSILCSYKCNIFLISRAINEAPDEFAYWLETILKNNMSNDILKNNPFIIDEVLKSKNENLINLIIDYSIWFPKSALKSNIDLIYFKSKKYKDINLKIVKRIMSYLSELDCLDLSFFGEIIKDMCANYHIIFSTELENKLKECKLNYEPCDKLNIIDSLFTI